MGVTSTNKLRFMSVSCFWLSVRKRSLLRKYAENAQSAFSIRLEKSYLHFKN